MRVQDLLLTPHESVKRVSLLGYKGKIDWKMDGNGIEMSLPGKFRPEVRSMSTNSNYSGPGLSGNERGAGRDVLSATDAGDMLFRVCREYRANRWRPVC